MPKRAIWWRCWLAKHPKANEAYVAALFDAFADSFDEKLVGWLDYRAPQQVAASVRSALGEGKVAARGIDLGCGTGLLAPELRGLVKHLDGVDLSPKMIEKARARKLYDALIVGEIVAELGKHPGGYDLVAAADVLSYFGDLRALFEAVRAALPDDGLFVATVEKGSGARYQAGKSGRYQHGEAYLRKRAAEAGFVVLSLDEIELRKEENKPVIGYVFALLAQETPGSQSAKLSATSLDDLVAGLTAPHGATVAATARRMIGKDFSIGWAIDLGAVWRRRPPSCGNWRSISTWCQKTRCAAAAPSRPGFTMIATAMRWSPSWRTDRITMT